VEKSYLSVAASQPYRWHYDSNTDRLMDTMCKSIAALASDAIQQRGVFSIVLAGGKTPEQLYRCIKNLETDWSSWKIYFGDERCLSEGHPDRNDTMASQAWLNHVAIAKKNIHSIHAENFQQGVAHYAAVIARAGQFDLVLLGLGEDGHTAALFPDNPQGLQPDSDAVVFISNAPKPPSHRISLSTKILGNTRALWLLATGESKKNALKNLQTSIKHPVSFIKKENGMDIFTDQLVA